MEGLGGLRGLGRGTFGGCRVGRARCLGAKRAYMVGYRKQTVDMGGGDWVV